MKRKLLNKKQICNYCIDYENGVFCNYTTENGKLTYYNFCNSLFTKLTHWSDHHKLINKDKFSSELELESFNDFDKLYYFGCCSDGMTYTKDNTPISTPIYLNETFCQCFLKIETTREECQSILDSLNKEWILESKINYIPYYNQNNESSNNDDHYTLSLLIKLPDNIYIKILNGEKNWGDKQNKKTFELLKL